MLEKALIIRKFTLCNISIIVFMHFRVDGLRCCYKLIFNWWWLYPGFNVDMYLKYYREIYVSNHDLKNVF